MARVLTQKRVLVTGELPVLVMVIHDSRGLVTTERGSWTRDGYFLEDSSMVYSTGRANSQATAQDNRQTNRRSDGRFGRGD